MKKSATVEIKETNVVEESFAIPSFAGYEPYARYCYEICGGKRYYLPKDVRVSFHLDTTKMSVIAREFLRIGWEHICFVGPSMQESFDALPVEKQMAYDKFFFEVERRKTYQVAFYDILCRIHKGISPQLSVERFIREMRELGWVGFYKGAPYRYRVDNVEIFRFTDENSRNAISNDDNKKYLAQAEKEYVEWIESHFSSRDISQFTGENLIWPVSYEVIDKIMQMKEYVERIGISG